MGHRTGNLEDELDDELDMFHQKSFVPVSKGQDTPKNPLSALYSEHILIPQ